MTLQDRFTAFYTSLDTEGLSALPDLNRREA